MNLRRLKDTPPWEWPPDAAEILLDALRDPGTSEADLEVAAELGGDYVVVNDELVEALLAILRSDERSEKVRGLAAISLGPVLEEADVGTFPGDLDELPIEQETLEAIRTTLRALHTDPGVPSEVRRRILEASVRAPEEWHAEAVRTAYASDDELWRLTAVFCMRFIRGFDALILDALASTHAETHREAVLAASNWEIEAAWPHVKAIVMSEGMDKELLLAAIEAVGSIRPEEAGVRLVDLADSDDEDIAAAVEEALTLAQLPSFDDDDFDDDDEP